MCFYFDKKYAPVFIPLQGDESLCHSKRSYVFLCVALATHFLFGGVLMKRITKSLLSLLLALSLIGNTHLSLNSWGLNYVYYVNFYDCKGFCAGFSVVLGEPFTPPEAAESDGFDFVGWKDNCGNIHTGDITLTDDMLGEYDTRFDAVYSDDPISSHHGKLESYVTTVILNSTDSFISEIKVDGTSYSVDGDFIDYDLAEYVGQDVVFLLSYNKVIWFNAVSNIETNISISTSCSSTLYYTDDKFNNEKLNIYISVYNNLKESIETASELKDVDELKVYISTVKVETSNSALLNFDGKDEIELPVNQYIAIGGSYTFELSADANSKYKMSDSTKTDSVTFTCELTGTQNSKNISATSSKYVEIKNNNYYKPTNIKNQATTSSSSSANLESHLEAQRAAKELSKISGTAAVGAMGADLTLTKIFTKEQLDAIGDMLICAVALASAPKDTFATILSEKVINKVFQCNTNLIGITSGSVSITVAARPEYGEVKVKFTCDFDQQLIYGSGYAYFGTISYEIIGGKGSKKLPDDCNENGDAGLLTSIDMNTFCKAAYALAESELKKSYSVGWGSEANKAADIIFNKTIIKILEYSKYKTVSGLTWELLTIPGKSVKIKCPVDVYVYNSNNELVAAIENNEPTLKNDLVEIIINGDDKEVILFDDSYYLVYEARAEGTMNIEVTEYGNSEGALKIAYIENIPLSVGVTYSQNIDMEYLEDSDYSLISADETVYPVVKESFLIHDHISDGDWHEGENSTCTQSGYKYTMCDVCYEWYYEYFSPLGHTDLDFDDYCDSCNSYLCKDDISLWISTPSVRTLNCGETITLYANINILPKGYKIIWKVEGNGVSIKPSSNGKICQITSTSTGNVVIKSYLVDSSGKIVTDETGKQISDSEYLYSEANFWLRLVAFFKKLFGIIT